MSVHTYPCNLECPGQRLVDHRAQAGDVARARSIARAARILLMFASMNITRSICLSLSLFTVGCAAVSADTSQTSSPSQTLVVAVPNAPPDPKTEVKTPCPAPGHIWVA